MAVIRLDVNELGLPPLPLLQEVMNQRPDTLEVNEWSEYEENIEFTVTIRYGVNIITIEGYTGLWEILSYDKMTPEFQKKLSLDLLEWIEFEYEYIDE